MTIEKQDRIIRIDEKSMKELYHSYFSPLCFYAKNFLSSQELSEEIVQETFIRLWENRQRIEIGTSAKSYLYRSVHNACLNYINNFKVVKKGKDFISLEDQSIDGKIFNYKLNEDILERLISDEFQVKIESLVEGLPDACKSVFKLSRYEEMSTQEIADKLNISVNTVKTQLSRALNQLRESLYS